METIDTVKTATNKPKSATAKAKADKEAGQRLKIAQRASMLLKHVSDPTRLQVVMTLAEGEQHVGALCAQLSQSQPAVGITSPCFATEVSSSRDVKARTTSTA